MKSSNTSCGLSLQPYRIGISEREKWSKRALWTVIAGDSSFAKHRVFVDVDEDLDVDDDSKCLGCVSL